jgi:ribonuclease G
MVYSLRREKAIAAEKIVREILVNVSPRETRIAVLENGQLMEVRFEREERVVGNIYKGVVQNVLPGMDAAFVNIGLERNAFLYVGDIIPEAAEGEEAPASIKRADLRKRNIGELLKVGQEILVQVIKAPRGTKGARVTTRLTLPGRYVVLMPDASHLGVSRKIEDRAERERLRQIGQKLHPSGFGLILRTEAEGKTEKEIKQDIEYLTELWETIRQRVQEVAAPALVHRDASLLYRVLRDIFSAEVARLWIDDPEEYEKVHEVLRLIAPDLRSRVMLYDKPTPLFDYFNVEKEMERLIRRKVWLKSGGYITIDETEAFTAIDVNTGKYTGRTSLADTILKTNLEAVEEIGRQLRLRDIGGIIVIDFIDMARRSDHRQVMQALQRVLKRDRARFRIGRISSLGLVELTRKRTGESVTEGLSRPCPVCHGRGRIPSPETVSLWIERELAARANKEHAEAYLVEAHPDAIEYLVGEDGVNIEMLEHSLECALFARARPDLPLEEYRIHPGTLEGLKRQHLPYRPLQVVECQLKRSAIDEENKIAWTADGYLLLWENEPPKQPTTKVKLSEVRRSFAFAEPVPTTTPITKAEVV